MTTQPKIFEGGDDDWLTMPDETAPSPSEETPAAKSPDDNEESLDITKLEELRKALNDKPADEKPSEKSPSAEDDLDDVFVDKVSKALEKRFGLSIDDIVAVLNGADTIVQQTAVQKQEQELREFWGDENYEENMQLVAERFAKLPEELQEKYDNVEGAKLLWALIQQERGVKESRKAKPQRETVRFIQGGKQAPGQGAAANTFKVSELLEMSQEEYRKNLPIIEAAFRDGRVINDVS
jgi:hypothetical protein